MQSDVIIPVSTIADIVKLAVAPVFLLSGIGAFLSVCAGRLARIVDRSRELEPRLLASRGKEHDRWLAELHSLDRRMKLVSSAITFSVLSAVITCVVVALLFVSSLVDPGVGIAIAILFIAAMVSIAISFAIFLIETRVGALAVRVRSELLHHRVTDDD